MSTLYISEYTKIALTNQGAMTRTPMGPPLAEQTVAIGASSTASAAFQPTTKFVRVAVDSTSPCSIAFGSAPVATAANMRLAANAVQFFGVQGGKVAVIENS